MAVRNRTTSAAGALAMALAMALTGCSPSDCGEGCRDSDAATLGAPADAPMLSDVLARDESLSALATAMEQSGLSQELAALDGYTLLAPTNAAIEALADGETAAVRAHVLAERLDAAQLVEAITAAGEGGHTLTMMDGSTLTAQLDEGLIRFTAAGDGDARSGSVIAANVEVTGGLVHVIDAVLAIQGDSQ